MSKGVLNNLCNQKKTGSAATHCAAFENGMVMEGLPSIQKTFGIPLKVGIFV